MKIDIIVTEKNTTKNISIEKDTLLIDALRSADVFVHAPCGGTGRCGKCLAEIEGIGDVLTCQTYVNDELINRAGGVIRVKMKTQGEAVIKSIGILPSHDTDPIVWNMTAELPSPSVADQMPDDERLSAETGFTVPWHLLKELPGILRSSDFKIGCTVRQDINEITSVYPSSEIKSVLGISIDIGTTTLSASMFDLGTGRFIASANSLNPQRAYGADVISRIDYASVSRSNLSVLRRVIVDELISLVSALNTEKKDISVLSFAGNTTMMHLLCGHDPSAIAKAPFIPVTKSGRILYFHDIFPEWSGMISSDPVCMLIPSLAGYVGADITAGIIATDLDRFDGTALLVDIGTNGEIALEHNGRILCCSVAAGPAFEGANIACGTGGVSGAVDRTWIDEGKFGYSTIGGLPASGICGSGIVSVVASFLKSGIIDDTGRFCEEDSEEAEKFKDSFVTISNERVFLIAEASDRNPPVYVTQKDIREIQNAKAAVCAGIRLLISRAGIPAGDVSRAYIAGGFGNFLDVGEAFTIGLLPVELKGKVVSAGNTSAAGSALCMLDFEVTSRLTQITEMADYYELSNDNEFTEMYVDAMFFDQVDI